MLFSSESLTEYEHLVVHVEFSFEFRHMVSKLRRELMCFHFYHASICEGGLGSRNSVRLSVTCVHCDKTK